MRKWSIHYFPRRRYPLPTLLLVEDQWGSSGKVLNDESTRGGFKDIGGLWVIAGVMSGQFLNIPAGADGPGEEVARFNSIVC